MPKPSDRPQALNVSEFKKYLNIPLLLWYYKEINKAGSLESDVDAFYNNFLKEVFPLRDNFGVEQESRPLKALGLKKTDFRIRYIKNGDLKKVILCENKKRDGESQDSVWKGALNQVVEYANIIRSEKGQESSQPLYLTVNIGTYLRFYELPGNATEPIDWAPAMGRYYELANDEEEVWELWLQIRNQVKSH
ncbi:hypothetical protein GGR54DRAFT_267081 [Hypoxylon sp. NC1633]|nr:hypothetical protein GGR54DRAFT_267081 [Hypoxylon sp. NC1633]